MARFSDISEDLHQLLLDRTSARTQAATAGAYKLFTKYCADKTIVIDVETVELSMTTYLDGFMKKSEKKMANATTRTVSWRSDTVCSGSSKIYEILTLSPILRSRNLRIYSLHRWFFRRSMDSGKLITNQPLFQAISIRVFQKSAFFDNFVASFFSVHKCYEKFPGKKLGQLEVIWPPHEGVMFYKGNV